MTEEYQLENLETIEPKEKKELESEEVVEPAEKELKKPPQEVPEEIKPSEVAKMSDEELLNLCKKWKIVKEIMAKGNREKIQKEITEKIKRIKKERNIPESEKLPDNLFPLLFENEEKEKD